ncbi:MAG: diphthine--ammonia ligase [Candidatus Diapherotrites archaeon]|nr:diphthine--ammonia ligase [Candidatus Diapherotrites archaeon]
MKLCALFSGGKDSTYAMYLARKAGHAIDCLLTIQSSYVESYMYHLPNIHLTKLQAEAMQLPQFMVNSAEGKEEELRPLREALEKIKKERGIEGITTGALASVYQKTRIEKICQELGLKCISPLWGKNEISYWHELLENRFKVMIVAVAAHGLDEKWLGRIMDKAAVAELEKIPGIHPAGEGGELETLVLDCPLFHQKLVILESEKKWDKNKGELRITKAEPGKK